MPTIDGQKVACMACIRGHRSSKCNHTDRLMMAVRKPGRPLSSCPHLPGARCGCGKVLAALPRQPSCGCPKPSDSPKHTKALDSPDGTSSTVDTSATTSTSSATAISSTNGINSMEDLNGQVREEKVALHKALDSPPVSPTTASLRVEKKTSRKSISQKPSFYAANLERMDASSLNIMPSISARTQHESIPMGANSPNIAMSLFGDLYGQGGNSSLNPPDRDYETTSLHPWRTMADFSVAAENATDSILPNTPVIGPRGTSSCCSPVSKTSHEPPTPNMGSVFQGLPPQSQPQLHVQVPPQQSWDPTNFNHQTQIFPTNDSILALNQTTSLDPQHSPYYDHNPVTMHIYPPSWGSVAHPLHPAQYQQFMSNYSQAGLQSSSRNPQSPIDTHARDIALVRSHQCSCGKDCQCIGCPAHPYNDSTQELIWDALKFQFDEDTAKGRDHTTGVMDANGMKPANGQATPLDAVSPVAANTPSDSASPSDQGEPAYSAENYIFVSYPLPPGSADSCPCGPACQCIDCVIHRSLDN